MPDAKQHVVTVGATGASGAALAQKALELLEADPRVARIHLVITETGQRLFAEELGMTSGDLKQLAARLLGRPSAKIEVLPNKDIGASIASGSFSVDSMLVIPCSMGTLAAIANGAREVNQLKAWTRCGMGPCQGRVCGEVAATLVASRVGGREAAGIWTARAPLRPLSLATMTGDYEYRDIPIPTAAPL